MVGLEVREATPDDVDDLLEVRNAIFPPVTSEQWAADPTMTCSLARLHGEPVGAIPLSLRPFRLAPGVEICAAYENAVGTREDLRSRGIGTAMIAAAREFLRGRADQLMVYRGDERSIGYRFYAKSGHCDLLYLRPMYLAGPQRREADAAIGDLPDLLACQSEMLPCFEAAYGGCGGFPPRHARYWEQQLASMIYRILPHDFHFVRHPAQGPLRGYAIVGLRHSHDPNAALSILELAGLDAASLAATLTGVEDLAARQGRAVALRVGAEHPCLGSLRAAGYREGLREVMILGQPIDPAGCFAKVCRRPELLADLRIDFWAPFADGTLHEGPDARTTITLEGKDEVIYRLLSLRLDVRAAVTTEWLTVRNGTADIVEGLAAALPYSPWVYHHLDYI